MERGGNRDTYDISPCSFELHRRRRRLHCADETKARTERKNTMRKFSLFVVGVGFLAFYSFSSSQTGMSHHAQETIVRFDDSASVVVVEAINRHELSLADQIIDAELEKDPASLRWLFLRSIRYYTDIFGPGVRNTEALAKMRDNAEKVIEIGEERLEKNPMDLDALFYAGGAYGYLGIAMAADGSMFSGVGKAKKGFNYHEDLIELCPACYDAYLSPGMMNLMTSAAPWFLQPILWVFGLSGTEAKAYEYLSMAFEKGKLVRLEAGTYLAQLYERRKEFRKSYEIYSELLHKYPMRVGLCAESLSPLWRENRYDDILAATGSTMKMFQSGQYSLTRGDSAWMSSIVTLNARAYRDKGDTISAVKVLENFLHAKEYQSIDKWGAHSTLAELYMGQRDTTRAITHYKEILASNVSEKTKKSIQERVEELEESRKLRD